MFEPGDKVRYRGIRPCKSNKYVGWWVMPGEEGVVVYVKRGSYVKVAFKGKFWAMYDGDLQRVVE